MNRNRRKFLRAAAAGGVAYAFGRTPGTVYAQMAGAGGFADYRALVCLFMFGGNDSWNMLVPNTTAEFDTYAASRGGFQGVGAGLAVPRVNLLPINPNASATATYGLHPSMAGIQGLFQSQRCALVTNVGPLVAPTTKAQYTAGSVPLPPQLFSHNDQQDQWHSLRGRTVSKSGWAGRIADLLTAQLPNQQLALNVSLAGQTFFQAGATATPYVMGATGPQTFTGFGTTGINLARRNAFTAVQNASYGTIYERGFASVQKRAVQFADRVSTAIANVPALTTVFPPGSALATQLQTVAKLIAARDQLSMTRQVFFVSTGGFDTHDDLVQDQPTLLGNISAAMTAFYNATLELGVASQVTTFTQSDFGRTLTSNGDGSDHAWGGNQLVVGGAVQGQKIYGTFPQLNINGPDDVGGGRLIPTTSADQYAATLAKWFGVTDAQLPQVAPSIANFATKDLGFLA